GRGRAPPAWSPLHPSSTGGLEGLRDPLETVAENRHDVERHLEAGEGGTRRKPDLRGSADPAALLLIDHLDRVPEPRAALRLHLAEDEPAAAAQDEVELVAGRPCVLGEDLVAAEPVVPTGAPLGLGPEPAAHRAAAMAAASSSGR